MDAAQATPQRNLCKIVSTSPLVLILLLHHGLATLSKPLPYPQGQPHPHSLQHSMNVTIPAGPAFRRNNGKHCKISTARYVPLDLPSRRSRSRLSFFAEGVAQFPCAREAPISNEVGTPRHGAWSAAGARPSPPLVQATCCPSCAAWMMLVPSAVWWCHC